MGIRVIPDPGNMEVTGDLFHFSGTLRAEAQVEWAPLTPEPGALKPLTDSCSVACFQGKEPLHKLDLFLVSGNGTLFITSDLLLYFQVLSLEAHVQGHVMHESRDSRF